jgi:two-component system chemotaxis sensor kinase CheA
LDRDKLIARLTATFLEELDEHVRVFNRELLALEQQPSEPWAERIKTLFRAAHSLKGAARAVNATRVEAICHRLEGVLATVRDGQSPPARELFELLFAAADAIDHAGKLFAGHGGADHEAVVNAMLARLNATQSGNGRSPQPNAPPAASAPNIAPIAVPRAPALRAETQTRKVSVAPPPASAAATPPPDAAQVVRVRGLKLDILLAQSGELSVARRRLEARLDQISSLQEFVARWRSEWRIVDKTLTKRARRAHGADDAPAPTSPQSSALSLTSRAERILLRNHEHLRRLERDLDHLALSSADDQRAIERAAVPLEEQIRQVRMLPFLDACEGLFRAVRDLAASQGKEVELVIENGDTELDRSLLDGLRDPLLHLVRNAIDHGIEPPTERTAQGKPPRAKITVSATVRGSWVEIGIGDDGRGIDVGAIREHARRRGIPCPDENDAAMRLIFNAGFSTARMITEVSGRGVGLDVVKTQVEQWRGTVGVTSAAQTGTRFTLTLPLTLSTIRALLVETGGQIFAIPSASITRLLRIDADAIRTIEGREVVLLGQTPIPIGSLATLFGLPKRPQPSGTKRAPAAVLVADGQLAAVLLDELVTEQEVVLKSLGARLKRLKYVSGATILPSGRIALVLSPAELVRDVVARPAATSLVEDAVTLAPMAAKRLILADDSVTTRTLEKSILEAAGYEVLTAVDGTDAWHLLQDKGADLVVSDVEMPKMDGFSLTETIRGSKRFHGLPVVLVTALETDRDRARGLQAGADAYLPKSTFDQKALLETIRQLL